MKFLKNNMGLLGLSFILQILTFCFYNIIGISDANSAFRAYFGGRDLSTLSLQGPFFVCIVLIQAVNSESIRFFFDGSSYILIRFKEKRCILLNVKIITFINVLAFCLIAFLANCFVFFFVGRNYTTNGITLELFVHVFMESLLFSYIQILIRTLLASNAYEYALLGTPVFYIVINRVVPHQFSIMPFDFSLGNRLTSIVTVLCSIIIVNCLISKIFMHKEMIV